MHAFKASACSAFLGITNAQVHSFFLTVSHTPVPQKFHLSPWKYTFRSEFTWLCLLLAEMQERGAFSVAVIKTP